MNIENRHKVVMTTDETTSERFKISGRHQILVLIPSRTELNLDGRVVTLWAEDPEDKGHFIQVVDPLTGDETIKWNNVPGFIEVEGVIDVWYQLRITSDSIPGVGAGVRAGVRATRHPIKNYVSSRPGR